MTTSKRDDTCTSRRFGVLVALTSAGVAQEIGVNGDDRHRLLRAVRSVRLRLKGNTTPVLIMRKRYLRRLTSSFG